MFNKIAHKNLNSSLQPL